MAMDIGAIAAAAALLGILVWVHFWEKRKNAGRKPTDPETLYLLARLTETSEFEQFRRAGESWNISGQRVEADFKRYLFQERIPPYVKDHLRKARQAHPRLRHPENPGRDPLLPPF
jgi:hypothetical protein